MQMNNAQEPLENLYLVVQEEGDTALEGEWFERAIVYASTAEEARDYISSFIDLCNEAEDAEPAEENGHLSDEEDEEEAEPIQYDPDSFQVVLLATHVSRPDGLVEFDADDILVFETTWREPE